MILQLNKYEQLFVINNWDTNLFGYSWLKNVVICVRTAEWQNYRLISRDRPTKTGSLCLCRPFFYVAALNVCIWRVVDVGWGGTISEIFEKKINDWFFVRLLYSNREERWDIFLFVQTEFTDLLFTGFEPKSFDLK